MALTAQLDAKRSLVVLGYVIILLAAFHEAHSTSGWIIIGVAPILWLDRYVFRLWAWPSSVRLVLAVLIRAGFFLGGALFFYQVGLGMVTLREAIYLGYVTSMAVFLIELTWDLAVRLADRRAAAEKTTQRFQFRNLAIMLGLLLLVLFLIPLSFFHPISLATNTTPSAAGLAYEEVRLQTADGLELAAWLVPHEQPRGSIIFCHGHGVNRQQSFLIMHWAHKMRLNLLAFDFRGLGESSGHTATFGLREAPDLLAAEAYLKEQFPDKPIFLFGISYGAGVALQALPQLQHVRAAWIESCFSRLSDAADNHFAAVDPRLRDGLIYAYSTLILIDCGCWPMNANPIDFLDKTRIPIFFCHGKEDDLVPFAQGQALYDRYQGPKYCYWVDKAGHATLHAQAGDEYARRLSAFFEAYLQEPGEQQR